MKKIVNTLAVVSVALVSNTAMAQFVTHAELNTEVQNRLFVDTAIMNQWRQESGTRALNDANLQLAIRNEKAAREAAITALQGSITSAVASAPVQSVNAVNNKIDAETARAQAAERKLDQKFSVVNAAAGATLVNVVAHELTPDAMKQEGVAFYGNVGQTNAGTAEVVVGVNKKFDNGFSAGVGVGTESAAIGVHAGWNHRVTENVKVGVGASISERGVQVGPHIQLTDESGEFGVGMGLAGPSVIIGGVNLPVLLPPVAIANVAVAGATKVYKAIDEKKQAPVRALQAELKEANAKIATLEAQMAEMMALIKANQAK